MAHTYSQAKGDIIRLHFHLIRCIAQQTAWVHSLEGSKQYIITEPLVKSMVWSLLPIVIGIALRSKSYIICLDARMSQQGVMFSQ